MTSKLIVNSIRHTGASADGITLASDGSVTLPGNATCSGTASGFSDYVKLQQASGTSGGSEIIFDNLDVTTYKFFDLVAVFQPANDAVSLRFRYREGGASGSNITGNSYSYGLNEKKDSNTSNCIAASSTKMILTGSIGNHASEGIGISMRISVGESGDNASAKWLSNFASWNAVYREQGNAARMTNGDINNYFYTLYGIKG